MKRNLLAPLIVFPILSGCHDRKTPNETTFTLGMKAYLERRGSLCVGKTTWPIDVTRSEAVTGSRDALQMPVLERLGLVFGQEAVVKTDAVEREVRRYTLTSLGQRLLRRARRSAKE